MSSTHTNETKSSRGDAQPLTPRKAANLISDLVLLQQGNIAAFRRKWDRLYRHYDDEVLLEIANQLRFLWHNAVPWTPPFSRMENLFRDSASTEQLRKDYEYSDAPERGISLPQFICNEWLRKEKDGIVIHWRSRQVKANPTSLPTVLSVSCLNHWPYFRICMNSDCANRYFIAVRKDQKYCSPECAEPAKLAGKRKWWNENRGANSKQQQRREHGPHKTR